MASQTTKRKKQKKETSKKITNWIFYITIAYFIFMAQMMYTTNDLSPSEYLSDVIKVALPIGIIAYMYRAVMTDKMEIQLKQTEESSKLKRKYGEDFITQELDEPDFLKRQ